MKYVKLLLCLIGLLSFSASAMAEEEGKLDISHIVLEHIKDSYEWHVTDIGDRSVIIHLPVIVHSSTGWHAFCSSAFEHHPNADGYRMGPHNLAIATQGDNAGKIVELTGGEEKRPFDISITKTVLNLFICAIILLHPDTSKMVQETQAQQRGAQGIHRIHRNARHVCRG